MNVFEEEDMYKIVVDDQKNRVYYNFFGVFDSVEKIPNYVEHSRKAIDMVSEGFSILSEVGEKTKPPSLTCTTPLKQSLEFFKAKKVSKVAIYIPKGNILHKMTVNVVSKLAGLTTKVFGTKEEAEAWLDEK